jgi:hypothetical protein
VHVRVLGGVAKKIKRGHPVNRISRIDTSVSDLARAEAAGERR